jgi:F-type H+-transporting ATPase subunit b
MRLDWSTIVLQTINFAVLVWLLQRFLYKPVLRMIDARKADIARHYDEAKAAEQKAKAHLAQVAAEREHIAAERQTALKAAAAEAQETAMARRAEAEREASAMIEEARRALAVERDKVLGEAKDSALDLGMDIARRLLGDVPIQIRTEGWLRPIEQYLKALPKFDFDALTQQLADGGSLTVATASALPQAMADTWRNRLRSLLGDGITITFVVRPDLIAGAELHFPGAVLQFSWQSALAAVRSKIDGHGDAHRRS